MAEIYICLDGLKAHANMLVAVAVSAALTQDFEWTCDDGEDRQADS